MRDHWMGSISASKRYLRNAQGDPEIEKEASSGIKSGKEGLEKFNEIRRANFWYLRVCAIKNNGVFDLKTHTSEIAKELGVTTQTARNNNSLLLKYELAKIEEKEKKFRLESYNKLWDLNQIENKKTERVKGQRKKVKSMGVYKTVRQGKFKIKKRVKILKIKIDEEIIKDSNLLKEAIVAEAIKHQQNLELTKNSDGRRKEVVDAEFVELSTHWVAKKLGMNSAQSGSLLRRKLEKVEKVNIKRNETLVERMSYKDAIEKYRFHTFNPDEGGLFYRYDKAHKAVIGVRCSCLSACGYEPCNYKDTLSPGLKRNKKMIENRKGNE